MLKAKTVVISQAVVVAMEILYAPVAQASEPVIKKVEEPVAE